MKETDPYGFPYPECDPPLVKDSSDIVQVRDLALAVDAEVTRLQNFANSEFIRPLGAKVNRSGSILSLATGQPITFNQIDFDNSPGATMATAQGIRIAVDGYYFIAGYVNTNSVLDATRVKLSVQGVGELLDEGEAYGIEDGVNDTCMMSGSIIAALYAGQLVQLPLSIIFSAGNVNEASLAVSRLTGI